MKKLLCVVLSLALTAGALSGCGSKKDAFQGYSGNSEFDEMIRAMGENIFLDDERAAIIDELSRNIYINNSRFALPMNVKDLPQGFEIVQENAEAEQTDLGTTYSTVMNYNGEKCCEGTVVISPKNEPIENGVIVSITTGAYMCKGSVGGIKAIADYDEITSVLGEPPMGGTDFWYFYVTEQSNILIFLADMGSFMFSHVVNVDSPNVKSFRQLRAIADENAQYIESHPYDDFDNMPTLPPLSGEPREIAWNDIADGIVIGDFKMPIISRISDLNGDFTISPNGTMGFIGRPFTYQDMDGNQVENEEYVRDRYTVYYKERELALVAAVRKKDEPSENALITNLLFMFHENSSFPFSIGVYGIPIETPVSDMQKYLLSNDPQENRFGGLITYDGQEYAATIVALSGGFTLAVTPLDADPIAYERYLDIMKK